MGSEHFPQEICPRQREVSIDGRQFVQDNGKRILQACKNLRWFCAARKKAKVQGWEDGYDGWPRIKTSVFHFNNSHAQVIANFSFCPHVSFICCERV